MHILITGTSSGIGLGLAQEYVARGIEVWGISRRNAEVLADQSSYHHLQLDLADFENVRQRIPEFLAGQDFFDLVILNAGVLGQIGLISEVDVDEMKRVMEINVWVNKVLLDVLFREGKEIRQVIGMSTKSSLRSAPGWGPYSVSKAALNMLMNAYAKEYPNTQFNAFAPGLVDSEIQEMIWNIKEKEKYPTVKKLQDFRYTDTMPDARKAAPMLIEGIEKVLHLENGAFYDVREI